jgi:hypothetical protein
LDELRPSPSTQSVAKLLNETLRDASRSTLSEGHQRSFIPPSGSMDETGEIVYGPISSGREVLTQILSESNLINRQDPDRICRCNSLHYKILN